MDLAAKHCHFAVPKLRITSLGFWKSVVSREHHIPTRCVAVPEKFWIFSWRERQKCQTLRRAFEASCNPYSHGVLPAGLKWSSACREHCQWGHCGEMTEGKKETVQKLQGKYSCCSLEWAWWAYLTSHTQCSLRGTKQSIEQSRDHTRVCPNLCREGNSVVLPSWKATEHLKNKGDKGSPWISNHDKIPLLGLGHPPPRFFQVLWWHSHPQGPTVPQWVRCVA